MKISFLFYRSLIFLFALLSTAFAGKGQNLVPNGDFELYTSCPIGSAMIDSVPPWTNPVIWSGSQSDYYNQCATSLITDVPTNSLGYQPAHSGGGYSGIFLYSSNWANLREYIQTTLTTPLVAGTCYHFEMYAALADRCMFTSDVLGAYISDTLMNGITNYYPLPVIPQISNPGIFPDTANWTLISGNYTASGGETYLIIGNFKYDTATTFINVNNFGVTESYMYIDDVSLSPCTVIEEQNNNDAITIFPNPVTDELHVQSSMLNVGEKSEIKIFDIMGKEIYRTASLASDFRLPTSAFQNGIYFIEINTGKNIFRKKFIKQ